MPIGALDPNDPLVFVNDGQIQVFDGSASGDTGLINNGFVQSLVPTQVTGISSLENSGSIIGEGIPTGSSGAVRLVDAAQTLVNSATGLIETTCRFGVWSGAGQTLELENDGIIRASDDALRVEQDAVIVNRGTIASLGTYNLHGLGAGATADGITAFANVTDGSAESRLGFELLNEVGGVISGPRSAIIVTDYSALIENRGAITGATSGIIAQSADALSLVNTGTITQTGNGPTGGSGSPYPQPRGAVESGVDTLLMQNSGVISAADYGVVVLGGSVIANEAGGEIAGTLGAITAYTEELAQVRVSLAFADISSIVLPFDAALFGEPSGQVSVLFLPELAGETGQDYLLPQFELRMDGKYYEIPGTLPTSYTRPDGSTATIDLNAALIRDASGRPLTSFDVVGSFDNQALALGAYDDTLDNRGVLRGDVNLGVGDDLFTNGGTIDGAAWLESGDDIYDGATAAQSVAVDGGAGNDRLTGGPGADTLSGGAGDDTLVGAGGDDALDGGADTDGARFTGVRAGYTVVLNADGSLTVTDTDVSNGNEGIDTLKAIERVEFADGEFKSGEGTDGDDEIDFSGSGGGAAAGSQGDDTYVCDGEDDIPVEQPGEGIDTVRVSINWTLGPNLEVLELTGSGNLRGTGNAAANTLRGNTGNNTLDGGAGVDTMEGADGNDLYICDQEDDDPVERAGDGIDTVRASMSWTLGVNLEILELTGMGNLKGTGNATANTLRGNTGDNTLDGGAGVDTLEGAEGNDTYVVDDPNDVVIERTDTNPAGVLSGLSNRSTGDREDPVSIGDVADALRSNASSYTLPTGVESATLLLGAGNGTLQGNSDANPITGNAQANLLVGGAGNDTLAGGLGNDMAVFSGARSDYLVEKLAGGVVRVTDTNLMNGDDGVDQLTGIEALRFADSIEGGLGKVLQRGTAIANTLNLTADGGQLAAGGAGNDVYLVNSAADATLERANAGRDRVDSTVSWVLWEHVEDLRLIGTKGISGRGNELGNRMEGNGAANGLKGYGGNDTLSGGAGADRLDGGDGADVLGGGMGNDVLTGGAGADTFLFNTTLAGTKDTIADFTPGSDRLQLDDGVFTAFTTLGALAPESFVAGANLNAAQDENDRIVYDTSTGALYYDVDGLGGNAAVVFALLTGAPVITAADVQIVG